MSHDPVTWVILCVLAVNTVLRFRTYRLEQRRQRLAQKRWDAIQQHVNETADAPLVWS